MEEIVQDYVSRWTAEQLPGVAGTRDHPETVRLFCTFHPNVTDWVLVQEGYMRAKKPAEYGIFCYSLQFMMDMAYYLTQVCLPRLYPQYGTAANEPKTAATHDLRPA